MPGNEGIVVKRDDLYRVNDRLLERKQRIEEVLREKEKGLFRLEEKIYLYDLTGSYFEGGSEGNSKARYGYSRDGRGDCKQVVVGLVIDEEGFVKGHEIYGGDRTDITMLKDTVERLRERGDKSRQPTVAVDRGMVSEENLGVIKGTGMKYIVAARHTERERKFDEFEGMEMKEIEQKIGRIKEKHRRVARYYEIETKESHGIISLHWKSNEADEGKYDGTYLLRTNRKDLTDHEIWSLYVMLTRVKRAFRNLKSNLGLRPIYHQKECRAGAHIFISVLAYHLLHAIEHALREKGETRSWNTINHVLQTHQVVTVVLPDADGIHVHHVRVATEVEAEQGEIYKKLEIDQKGLKKKRVTFKKAELYRMFTPAKTHKYRIQG